MIVVPAHVFDTWQQALKDLWPNATVWCLRNQKSFSNLSQTLLPGHPHLTRIDVLLVSRDVFFRVVASDTHRNLEPTLDRLLGQESPDLNVLERVQFNTVVLDEAHAYTIFGNLPATYNGGVLVAPGKFRTFDGGVVFSRSAVTIRKLAYGRSTLLLTATPFPETMSTFHVLNNYLMMIGMTHTEYGPIVHGNTSGNTHAPPRDGRAVHQSHPSQITPLCKTKMFFTTVDPSL